MYFILAIGLMILSSTLVNSKFEKYRKIPVDSQLTGAETARAILDYNGLQNVSIQAVNAGTLSDFYDPKNRSVHLSPEVYNGCSIVSVAVAAHEVGHAIQHKTGYRFLEIRNLLLPAALIGSNLGWLVIIIGASAQLINVIYFGVALILLLALFQLITLPVEFDASKRAGVMLKELNIVASDELDDVKSMLNAAAFTYVAALITTFLYMFHYIGMGRKSRN